MINVLSSGIYSSIQDRGRIGFADIGVPVSGVMDAYSANLANTILNNSLEVALLEITFGGCVLEFITEIQICVTGADFSPKLNGKEMSLNTLIHINEGTILSFGKINYGVRCYVAVKGGFLTEKVLESSSYYHGITKDFLIRKNDELPIETFHYQQIKTNTSVKTLKSHFNAKSIICYKGPEYELLNLRQKKQLETMLFTISKDNNRMGYRLEEVIENDLSSMLTSAVLPGTVQLTPAGKLIILMRDCQVTGGYPRVLQLSENAINILAQKTTGHQITFNIEGL